MADAVGPFFLVLANEQEASHGRRDNVDANASKQPHTGSQETT